MTGNSFLRLAGASRRKFVVLVALMAPLACLGAAATAQATELTGGLAIFKQCPRFTPGVVQCLYVQTTSGEYVVGHTTIPITNPVTLQGGVIINEETGTDTFVEPLNGEILSRTPQPVPGGLFGTMDKSQIPRSLRRVLDGFSRRHLFGVTATVELAQPVSAIGLSELSLLTGEGASQSLPVKIKLDNPFLGRRCYIGSSSNPIILNLTDGETHPPAPNQPIKGKFGELEFQEDGVLLIKNNSVVDNSFSAPKATGCGGYFSFLVDHLIDAKFGLPSAAGNNTVIQNGTLDVVGVETLLTAES
jgi:hypothetical protein